MAFSRAPVERLRAAASGFSRRDAWREGRIFFEDRVRRNPREAEAHAHLAFFCVKESAYDTARGIAELDRAIALDPGCVIAYIYRAIVLGSLGRSREALAAVRLAKRLGAPEADLAWAKGCIHLDAWRMDRAIDAFRRLAALSPTSTSLLLLSQAYSQAGQQGRALQCARRAQAADPRDFRGRAYAGVYLAYLGRLAEARIEVRRALNLKRDFAMMHHTMAYIARREGNVKEAERHLREALRIDPLYATSRKMLADICAQSGREAEAREHYAATLKHFPDYPEARKALNRLNAKRKSAPNASRARR